MGCCASFLGCYRVSDSVVVVGNNGIGNDDKKATTLPSAATTSPSASFPPPHEVYGIRPLASENVVLCVQNTPGKVVKKRFRSVASYKHHAVEVAACSHLLVTDQRLLVLFKPFYGGSVNLLVRWDDPVVQRIRVSVVEGDKKKKNGQVDLLVLQWEYGEVMQLPNVSGDVEVRLRTPHAKLIRDAILTKRKGRGGGAASLDPVVTIPHG